MTPKMRFRFNSPATLCERVCGFWLLDVKTKVPASSFGHDRKVTFNFGSHLLAGGWLNEGAGLLRGRDRVARPAKSQIPRELDFNRGASASGFCSQYCRGN